MFIVVDRSLLMPLSGYKLGWTTRGPGGGKSEERVTGTKPEVTPKPEPVTCAKDMCGREYSAQPASTEFLAYHEKLSWQKKTRLFH